MRFKKNETSNINMGTFFYLKKNVVINTETDSYLRHKFLSIRVINSICPKDFPLDLKKKIHDGTIIEWFTGVCKCGFKPGYFVDQYRWDCPICKKSYYA